jgi:hypothetical protein
MLSFGLLRFDLGRKLSGQNGFDKMRTETEIGLDQRSKVTGVANVLQPDRKGEVTLSLDGIVIRRSVFITLNRGQESCL